MTAASITMLMVEQYKTNDSTPKSKTEESNNQEKWRDVSVRQRMPDGYDGKEQEDTSRERKDQP
eukprot:CAMPEP_0174280878 /NCGR_PEP_ID=MMETSP0809-20121228/1203_1 /TAXON_ID=73025 ORGANISM="Eutreptiella gymnastica-like, Strain CCMP1594" /NCGR_SAMPLE_ID=MMETSP0809 /ASSEMBLY_ACC=CAM_ASM_000658 /LENGTH=63 /DNA_ID=CAMNT_0015374059 /DNA_START=1367 /DNA_END=1558 /DNA_ORIENTATION=-